MDRIREVRRSSAMAATTNGNSRRRYRSNSPRDSPEEGGPMEMHEPGRLQGRAAKKERDRFSRSKRRRNEDESSEESVNVDVEEDEHKTRMLPPHPAVTNHHHSHLQLQHLSRNKGAIGSNGVNNKAFRSVQGWKPADEMIGFSVPRKARSASVKRLQENLVSSTGATPQASPLPSAAPLSPSSSNISVRKKLKSNGSKKKPPKSSPKASSSNQEGLENEIAEVLYGLMTQFQAPLVKETDSSAKFNPNRPNEEPESRDSSPISTSASTAPLFPDNPSSSTVPYPAVAPKQVSENSSSFSARNSPNSSTVVKSEFDKPPKIENLLVNSEKSPISESENGINFTSLDTQTKEIKAPARSLTRGAQLVKPEGSHGNEAVTKVNLTSSEMDIQKEEKFGIDPMAPPPQIRSSSKRESENDFAAVAEPKPVAPILADEKSRNEKVCKSDRDEMLVQEPEHKKVKSVPESEEALVITERNIDLQRELEKPDRDRDRDNSESVSGHSKSYTHVEKQQQPQVKEVKVSKDEKPHAEKSAQPSSLPLPMSLGSWPGGLPPMGFMPPVQGVVSMDGSQVPPPIQLLFSQPRPKRCDTHCYIARNIHYHQQFMKMNPFWPAPAGPTALFGQKMCNLPSMELQGRAISSVQDKEHGLGILPGGMVKEKDPQDANIMDAQRKQQQILLQQALPPGAASSNMMCGPAFIFPFNQQQPAAAVSAASIRPGPTKSASTATNPAAASAATSASMNGSAPAVVPTLASVSFNYPNIPLNETQYLAILQNNPYPFPIPASAYRGTHPQPMPFFNGSFYAPQMIHPSQLQEQQPGQQVSLCQQNATIPNSSAPAQKQQQKPEQGNGNSNTFPAPKTRPAQSESCNQASPSTDSRSICGPINIYGQNYSMPVHHQNFALVRTCNGNNNNNNNKGENKKQQHSQHSQQQGSKSGGVESLPQTFAMSFASMNGGNTAPGGIDLLSVAQNHHVFQNLSEADRRNHQVIQAAVVAQAAQQKNFRVVEEGKNGDSFIMDDEKKGLAPKPSVASGQSIAFSKPESTDCSVSSNIIDSSARNANPASSANNNQQSSRNSITSSSQMGNLQNVQFQQQQMMQSQKQQQQYDVARNNKPPPMNNGSFSNDRLATSSPSAASKFPNTISNFPPNLGQSGGNNSPTHSPQWKNSVKNLPQPSHTQTSFGLGPKPQTSPHGQQTPSTNQSSSPTSSLSKGAGGSPRTPSSNSQVNKATSSLSQQSKNSASVPYLKTPSILGGTKSQAQQQQMKQMMNQQPQLFYSHPYMQTQPPQSSSNPTNTTSGYYLQKRYSEKQHGGALSVTPVTGVSSSTAEAKAGPNNVSSSNTKGHSQNTLHHSQFQAQSSGGFSYTHTVPVGVQVKATAEQKQQTAENHEQVTGK